MWRPVDDVENPQTKRVNITSARTGHSFERNLLSERVRKVGLQTLKTSDTCGVAPFSRGLL